MDRHQGLNLSRENVTGFEDRKRIVLFRQLRIARRHITTTSVSVLRIVVSHSTQRSYNNVYLINGEKQMNDECDLFPLLAKQKHDDLANACDLSEGIEEFIAGYPDFIACEAMLQVMLRRLGSKEFFKLTGH